MSRTCARIPHEQLLCVPYKQHDRQCTYNVTLRRFRVTIGVVEKQ